MGPDQFQGALTSKQLKVKLKANSISGLQLADLLAHPSRNEILKDQGLLDKDLAPFAQQVVRILQRKYDQREGKPFGKKFLEATKKALAGPMAFAIHLRQTGLIQLS